MPSVPALQTLTLPHPADSLSILPSSSTSASQPSVLACGTYRLIESTPQRRIGSVQLYEILQDSGSKDVGQVEAVGILDLQWATRPDRTAALLTADAEGYLNLYTYDPASSALTPTSRASTSPNSKEALALSLSLPASYKPLTLPSLGPALVSLSNGELSHLLPRGEGYEVERCWKGHEHEAWDVSWGHEHQPDVLYSGSDDLTLKGWDLRAGTESPTFVTRRFDAGVVSIVPSSWNDNELAVGTYDSLVRIYDTRSPARALQTHPVSGGAWRLAFHPSPSRKDQLLVAAMHGGAEIIRLGTAPERKKGAGGEGGEGGEGEEAGKGGKERVRFEGHESMCYGAKWVTGDRGKGEDIVASCSFYDQKLCLWRA